jgi:hypothetical protein
MKNIEKLSTGKKVSAIRKIGNFVICPNDTTFIISTCAFSLDGKSFEIVDPRALELEILPRYFRHARFQSLVRQLNFYAFKVRTIE